MVRLGVSVYPEQETIEEIEQYLQLASKYGFSKVFTSMFSVPGTKEEVFDYFKNFTEIAHKYNMIVCGDCNTEFFKKMEASEKNLKIFKEMDIDVIRMDMSYMDHRDVELINNDYGIGIEMTAAMWKPIELAIKNGANPENFAACHNFYPERYTGADLASVKDINQRLRDLNVKCAIFISSNVEGAHGPWPVQNGLPTLEDHRWMDVDKQVKHLIAMGNIDEILFGNAFASEDEFRSIYKVVNEAFIDLPKDTSLGLLADYLPHGKMTRIPFGIHLESGVTDIEKKILYDSIHNSAEYTYYMLRSRWGRIKYLNQEIPVRSCNQEVYHRGDVVIVNDNLKHYRGELQVVLKDMKVDGQRNLLGHLPEDEMILLDEITLGSPFCFME